MIKQRHELVAADEIASAVDKRQVVCRSENIASGRKVFRSCPEVRCNAMQVALNHGMM